MSKQVDTIALVGRILLAMLFLMSGLSKLAAPSAIIGYIQAVGLPAPTLAFLAAVVIEVIGSLLLIGGFRTRSAAVVLAFFTLLTAAFFHNNFADQNQMIHFMKNVSIIGGLLQVAAFGAGRFSLDHRFARPAKQSASGMVAAE
jgi:putative oxidoreductase